MIVVDSSVWIATLRKLDTPETRRLDYFIRTSTVPILVGDVVLLVVLRGARNDAHAARLERNLRRFPVVAMLEAAFLLHADRDFEPMRQHFGLQTA